MHSTVQTGVTILPTVLTGRAIGRLQLAITGACADRDIIRHSPSLTGH